jgi:hypothetical protein
MFAEKQLMILPLIIFQCKAVNAPDGEGISMSWPSTGERAVFSRLSDGDSNGCMRVDGKQVRS